MYILSKNKKNFMEYRKINLKKFREPIHDDVRLQKLTSFFKRIPTVFCIESLDLLSALSRFFLKLILIMYNSFINFS